MTKFIKQIISFLIPVFFVMIFLFIYSNVVIKKITANYKLNSEINKIAIGDSHISLSINDSILHSTKNFAAKSENFIYSFYKIVALTNSNPQIDTILLGASYHNFSKYSDNFIFNTSILKIYFYMLPVEVQFEMIKKINNPLVFIISSLRNLFISNKYYEWIGGFSNYSTNVLIDEKSILKRINSQYYENGNLCGFSKHNILYFKKIVNYCKKNNIELIIINTPLHKNYKKKIPQVYIDKFYSLITNSNLDIIEFDEFDLEDIDFLPDGDHVSKEGSIKTSKIIDSLIVSTKSTSY
jgi:hypothetical protein